MRFVRFRYLAALLALTVLGAPVPALATLPTHSAKEAQAVRHSASDFGLDLFQRLYRQQPEKNLFMSPTSIYLALAMLYTGAEGQTRLEMAKVLRLSQPGQQIDDAALKKAAQTWLQQLGQSERGVLLEVANAVWVRQGLRVRPDYLKSLQRYFEAEAHEAPFNPATLKEINAWVSQQTHGKIPKILDQLDGDMALLLLNAIYFKGEWQTAFDPKQTREQAFHLDNGMTQTVPLMQRRAHFDYFENEMFQAVRLPYGKTQATDMVVFLPKSGHKLSELVAQMTPEHWQQWQRQFQNREGVVMLPRFQLNYRQNLNETLKAMGMPSAFGKANFSRMAEAPLAVSFVLHKAFVEVNEQGTEAAAVTGIGMRITSVSPIQPFVLRADHPFCFAIVDRQQQDPLFMGTLVKPLAQEGSSSQ